MILFIIEIYKVLWKDQKSVAIYFFVWWCLETKLSWVL